MKLETTYRKRPNRARPAIYCIEGENVTIVQIAARIGGVTIKTASSRLSHIKQYHPAVTWALLGEKRK